MKKQGLGIRRYINPIARLAVISVGFADMDVDLSITEAENSFRSPDGIAERRGNATVKERANAVTRDGTLVHTRVSAFLLYNYRSRF